MTAESKGGYMELAGRKAAEDHQREKGAKECNHCFHPNYPAGMTTAIYDGSQKCCWCGIVTGQHGPHLHHR